MQNQPWICHLLPPAPAPCSAARRAAARTAHGQLHRQDRQTHEHQKEQVKQHKDAAAALAGDCGEAPDVADADSAARADQNEAKREPKLSR